MEQLLVDMDGVLADVYAQFIRLEFLATGIRPAIESLHGKLEADAFPHYETSVRSTGFFSTAPRMEGSIDGLKYLNDKYKVLVVSSATEFPGSLIEKYEWLTGHYPFISWKQIIFCGDKSSIRGDIMVDDHPKNLDSFSGRKILFTQPHNILLADPGFERADNWEQLLKIL